MRVALAFIVALGCSSSSEAPPQNDAAELDTAVLDDTGQDTSAPEPDTSTTADSMIGMPDVVADVDMFGAYPSGPYGNGVGQVMANLAWEGYVNDLGGAISTTKPYVASTNMDQLRKKAPKGYALVHVSEFY